MKKSKFVKMQKAFSDFRVANEIYSCRLDDPRDRTRWFSHSVLYYDITSAKKALRMISNLIGGDISEDQMKLTNPRWDNDLVISSGWDGGFYKIEHSDAKQSLVRKLNERFCSDLIYYLRRKLFYGIDYEYPLNGMYDLRVKFKDDLLGIINMTNSRRNKIAS